MFFIRRPTPSRIAVFVTAQHGQPFTYPEVGGTRGAHAPAGYAVDRNRVRLGAGAATFKRAAAALRRWEMLRHGWAFVAPADAAQAPGTPVVVVARHYGFWSLNACRVVYALDDARPDAAGVRRVGFAYGTLPEHGAVGEERFSVEWRAADDSVWFDLYAFSRPRKLLAWLGYPLGRRLQRRFAEAAKAAMVAAAEPGTPRDVA